MNTNMKRVTKILACSLSILLMIVLSASADDASVSRLNLNPGSGETVLKIDVTGPFQFVHETAEAKDGKPFRVVVDIFPAIHELSQKDYTELPKSLLSSIRTSQYSVNPEKIVRIVCDLDQTVMYRVEKKGNSVYLYLPDKKSGQFASWSSPIKAPVTVAKVSTDTKEEPAKKVVTKKIVRKVETVPVKTAKTQEKAKVMVAKHFQAKSSDFIDHDKFLSTHTSSKKDQQVAKQQVALKKVVQKTATTKPVVESKPTVTTAAVPTVEKVTKKKVVQKIVTTKPVEKSKSIVTTAVVPAKENSAKKKVVRKIVTTKPVEKSKPTVTTTAVPAKENSAKKKVVRKIVTTKPVEKSKPTVTTTAVPAEEKTAKKKVVKVDSPMPEPKSSKPVQEYTMVKKTAPIKKEITKPAPVVKKSGAKPKEVASVDLKKTEKGEDKQKPTSRFRRKPTFPAKLKGTIVAEFPTRMVMKYRPGTGRDPFKNLLTATKGNNSPIRKKIPDVETAKLVGVLESADGKKRALLEDHDGYGYILKSGDKIKKGYVGKIYSDRAYFKLFEYGWSRTVALYMSIN